MSAISIKKILLTGTALVAVTALSTRAQAVDVPQVATGALTWASSGTAANTLTNGTDALSGDDLDMAGQAVTVTNNNVAYDNTISLNKNHFGIGALTDSIGTGGSFTVTTGAAASNLFLTVNSVNFSHAGEGAFTVNNTGSAVNAAAVTITTTFSTTGNVVLLNSDTTTAETVTLLVGADATITGTTHLTAGTGGVGANTVLTLNGGSNTLSGLVTLTDAGSGTGATNGQAILDFGAANTADTVTVGITGGGANEGVVNLLGSNVVSGAIGTTNAVYAVNAGVQGTTSSISGAVITDTVTVNGGSDTAGTGSVTFGGALTVGARGLTVSSAGVTTAQVENATVTGDAAVAGVTTVTAGSFAGANAALTLNGAANTLTGATNLTANTTGTTASLNLNGAANTLTGLVTLTDSGTGNTGGQAIVNFGAANTTDTLTNGINAAARGDGTVNLLGSNVITGASGSIGTINAVNTLTAGANGSTSSISGTTQALNVILTGSGAFTNTGAVTATNLDINGTGTVNLGDATHNITNTVFNGDGTVSLAAGGTLVSTVTAGTTDIGTLTFAGAGTLTGTLGSSTAEIKAFNAGVEFTASTVTGPVYAKTVTIDGGTDAANAGSVTFNSTLNVGAGGMTVSSHDTTTFAQAETATVTGAFTDAGVLNIKAGTAAGANATLNLGDATDTITGVTTMTDGTAGVSTLNVAAGSTITFTGGIVGGGAGEGTLALAGAATVNGAIGNSSNALKAVTLAGGGLDVFSGSIFATALTYDANNTAQIADTQNVTAAITTTVNNTGTLTLLGTSTIADQIGTGPDVLFAINAGAAAGKADTFNDAIFATTLNVGAGSVDLKGATTANLVFGSATGAATLESGLTLVGNVNGAAAGDGNLTLAGTNTITGEIGNAFVLNALTLSGAGLTDTVTSAATTVNAANTTTLGTNTLAVGTNNFTLGAGQTLVSTITSNAVYGSVTSTTGATVVSPTAKVNLTVTPTVYLPTHTYVLIGGGAGAGVSALGNGQLTVNGVTDTSAQTLTEGVLTYTQIGAGGDELEIEATNNGAVSVASNPNNSSVGHALDTIAGTGNAALEAIEGRIAAAPSAAAVNTILSTLTPTVDGGSQIAALEVSSEVQDITDTRMAARRADDGTTGVAAGVGNNGVSMWVQGYGQASSQREEDFVAGYSAETWGAAAGFDSENIIDNGLFGVAFNYGNAHANSKNANTTFTDIDNYGFLFYGTVGLQDQMFVNGQAGFAYNTISSIRHDVGGAGGPNADGSTHSDQYDARATFGRDFPLDYDMTFTPDMAMSYTRLGTQAYTETGSGANLDVQANSQNNLDLSLGAKTTWKLKNEDGSLMKPLLYAGYSYAAVDDRIDTTASFTGAAAGNDPAFVTQGPVPERNRFDVGAGFTYMTTANWDLTANYDLEYRSDFLANTGTLRATAHF